MIKQLPQNIEAEKSIIGICIQWPEKIALILDEVKSNYLYNSEHLRIYEAIKELWMRNKPVDLVSIPAFLKKENDGKLTAYLMGCQESVVSSANYLHYCELIVEAFRKREIIRNGQNMIQNAQDGEDSHEIIDRFSDTMLHLQGDKKDVSLLRNIHELNDMIDRKQENDFLIGIPSGLHDLDRVTCGWQKKDLIILAARPSKGKTSLAINCIRNAAIKGKNVGFFSLEMSDTQITARILAQEASVNIQNLLNGTIKFSKVELGKYTKAQIEVSNYISKVYFDEFCRDVASIRARAFGWKLKYGLDLMVVDFLQMMTLPKGSSPNEGLEYITNCMKNIAKDLDIPVLLLSQLTRANDRDNREPELYDLRSSGGIEQSADIVIFIHSKRRTKGGFDDTWLLTKKNRNGPLGRTQVEFKYESALFSDYKIYQKPSPVPYAEQGIKCQLVQNPKNAQGSPLRH